MIIFRLTEEDIRSYVRYKLVTENLELLERALAMLELSYKDFIFSAMTAFSPSYDKVNEPAMVEVDLESRAKLETMVSKLNTLNSNTNLVADPINLLFSMTNQCKHDLHKFNINFYELIEDVFVENDIDFDDFEETTWLLSEALTTVERIILNNIKEDEYNNLILNLSTRDEDITITVGTF